MVAPSSRRHPLFISVEELPGYSSSIPNTSYNYYTSDGRLFVFTSTRIYEEKIDDAIIEYSRENLENEIDVTTIVYGEIYYQRRRIWSVGNPQDVPTLC